MGRRNEEEQNDTGTTQQPRTLSLVSSLSVQDVVDLRWRPLSVNMSQKRQYCAASAVGGDVVVVGGHDGKNYLGTAELLHHDEWSSLPPIKNGKLSVFRHGCAMVTMERDVIVMGGFDGKSACNTAHIFNRDTDSWKMLAPMRIKRTGCAAAGIGRRVFCLGGFDGNQTLSSCEVWDAATRKWSSLPPMLERRNRCAATVIDDGRTILVLGGNDGQNVLASGEMFSLDTQSWTHLPANMNMIQARSGFGVVTVGKFVIAVGGFNGTASLRSVEMYNLETGTWHLANSLSKPREGCAAVRVGDDKVVVVGGYDGHTDLSSAEQLVLERVDPKPPALPPIPSSGGSSSSGMSKQDCIVALEAWADDALTIRKQFKDKATKAACRVRDDFVAHRNQLEQEIKKKEHEIIALQNKIRQENSKRKQTISELELDTTTWLQNLDQQVLHVTERVEELHKEQELHRKKTERLRHARSKKEGGGGSCPPSELLCCITLELMKDPVIAVGDGHTYERRAIERVFATTPQGHFPRSPKTGQLLKTRQLVSNVAIRSMCRDYAKA